MFTRREFVRSALGAGLALAHGPQRASAQTPASQLERNKAVVRRFKESQGTRDEAAVMRVVDGKWTESWYFGDELGLLLQLGAVDMLQG